MRRTCAACLSLDYCNELETMPKVETAENSCIACRRLYKIVYNHVLNLPLSCLYAQKQREPNAESPPSGVTLM
jgi:hypothetical protein